MARVGPRAQVGLCPYLHNSPVLVELGQHVEVFVIVEQSSAIIKWLLAELEAFLHVLLR